MGGRYQNGCLYRERRKAGPDVWVFRWRDGKANRKEKIGTVDQFTNRKTALKVCEAIRTNINLEVRSPRTVAELVSHYTKNELGKKAYSTQEIYSSDFRLWILPAWGDFKLRDVKAVAVEAWLENLSLSNPSKAKIRNIMSALFTHAMRYEFTDRNPISLVRQSAKRMKEPVILTTEEVCALLPELREPAYTAVLLACCTGMRVSELLALKWADLNFDASEIRPVRGIFHQHIGELKTEASRKPLPMDSALASAMLDWRGKCPFNQDADYVFGSVEMNGAQPYWPDSLLRRIVRPAAVRAGITKNIGWHSFRRTLATLLQSSGGSVKATQDLLRHANSKITLDLYAQSIPAERREAQMRVTGAFHNASVPIRSQIVSGEACK